MKLINTEVRIETTNRCNAACVICPREKMTRKKTTMGMGHFKSLVDQCKDLGAETISVFGYGEPLTDKTLVEKVAYCSEKGLKTFITTNASLLNTIPAYGLLKAGLSHIRFSVHGTFDNYEKVHRGLVFTDVLRNIGNFIQANKTRFDHSCRVDVSVIPMTSDTATQIAHPLLIMESVMPITSAADIRIDRIRLIKASVIPTISVAIRLDHILRNAASVIPITSAVAT